MRISAHLTASGRAILAELPPAQLRALFGTREDTDLRLAGEKDMHVSCLCHDGMWTPMLFDKLEEPGASMSFSGVLLQPEQIAERALRILGRPRAVTSVPRWRGVQARAFDLVPGLAARLAPWVVRLSRVQQRATARRLRGA